MSSTHRRARRLAARGGIAVSIFALPLVLGGPAGAESTLAAGGGGPARAAALTAASTGPAAAPSLGGWNVTADGNAVDILMDNATGLAGIHPFTEADFPEAQSQFASGPFGSALATVFWPGSAGGNFGSLSTELGFPSQLQPLTAQMNDPVRASAQYPSGPATADYPGNAPPGAAVMHATAQPGGTTAEGSITDASPEPVLSFSSAKGTSSSTATDKATADAATNLSDISILGGLIDIGSITSTAEAVSDGAKGTGTALTHVSGVTVLGQKASIGSDGLVLPNFPSALGPITGPLVQNALSQMMSGLGLTVTELPSAQVANGAGFTATSGALSIGITPPSSAAPILEQAASVLAPFFPSQAAIVPTLPGLLQGMTLTITLGRATASANASAPFDSNFNPSSAPTGPVFGTPAAGDTGGSGSAAVDSSAAGGTNGSDGFGPSVAAAPGSGTGTGTGGSSGPAAQPAATLINLSSPLGTGALVLGILVAMAAGYGLWRLGRMVLPSDRGPVCPLGQDQT